MRGWLAVLSMALAAGAFAQGPGKPDVYRHGSGEQPTGLDKMVLDAYSARFNIVHIEGGGYEPPRPLSGRIAAEAISPSGEALTGYVLMAFLVTAEGRAAEPVVLKSTDRRLNPYAIRSVTLWRFKPATYRGRAITTMAAQEFNFK